MTKEKEVSIADKNRKEREKTGRIPIKKIKGNISRDNPKINTDSVGKSFISYPVDPQTGEKVFDDSFIDSE